MQGFVGMVDGRDLHDLSSKGDLFTCQRAKIQKY